MSAPIVGDGMQSLVTLLAVGCRDKTPRESATRSARLFPPDSGAP